MDKLVKLQLSPNHIAPGLYLIGVIRFNERKFSEAEDYFLKSLQTDSTYSQGQIANQMYLALIAEKQNNPFRADSLFQVAARSALHTSALEKSFVNGPFRLRYGQFLMRQNRYEEAREQFRLAEEFQPKCYEAQYGYALLAAAQKRQDEALDYLEKALDYWLPEAEQVLEEPLFKKIRKTRRFKALMAKHFPEAGK